MERGSCGYCAAMCRELCREERIAVVVSCSCVRRIGIAQVLWMCGSARRNCEKASHSNGEANQERIAQPGGKEN